MKQVTTLRKNANRKYAKRKLSIHEISPQWAQILPLTPRTERQEFYRNNQKLDISDCRYCVVGEAHGFNDSYAHADNEDFCYECYDCSTNFGYALTLSPENREGLINTFVDHWNTTHV